MRKMNDFFRGDFGERVDIPAIPVQEWWDKLNEICQHCTGRDISDDERSRAQEMMDHNWTVRVVADELYDEPKVSEYFLSQIK